MEFTKNRNLSDNSTEEKPCMDMSVKSTVKWRYGFVNKREKCRHKCGIHEDNKNAKNMQSKD